MFFTGAGVSVGAGLPTYRGAQGMYSNTTLEPPHARDITPDRLPALWARFAPRLLSDEPITPARAHLAIAEFERSSAQQVTVVTQNVDGLHALAGSTRVVELHGNLQRLRCLPHGHRHQLSETDWQGEGAPVCPTCAGDCRPDVVLFGEGLDSATWARAEDAVRTAATVVAAGTSGVVRPAAHLIAPDISSQATRIWINPETAPPDPDWHWLHGSADEQLPRVRPV